jgi:hypothetical protein
MSFLGFNSHAIQNLRGDDIAPLFLLDIASAHGEDQLHAAASQYHGRHSHGCEPDWRRRDVPRVGSARSAVYVNGTFAGVATSGQTDDLLMACDSRGYWTGFIDAAGDGDLYHFYVVGAGSQGYKRDPYAREMALDSPFPTCSCAIRSATAPGPSSERFQDRSVLFCW